MSAAEAVPAKAPLSAFLEAFEPAVPGVRGVVRRTFELMDIAEQEIAAEKGRWRRAELRDRIHKQGFMACQPGVFSDAGMDDLYRAHCREMLVRLARGLPLDPGTDAEIIWAISKASLKAPPSRDVGLLACRLWRKVFPGKPDPWAGDDPGSFDEWAVNEIERDLRKRMGRARGVKP